MVIIRKADMPPKVNKTETLPKEGGKWKERQNDRTSERSKLKRKKNWYKIISANDKQQISSRKEGEKERGRLAEKIKEDKNEMKLA